MVALLSVSCQMNAQSKPKRDVSKDRSVIVAKQQDARKKAVNISNQKKRKKSLKRYNRSKPIQRVATYLRVNQLSHINKTINAYGIVDVFNVNTDGRDWNVLYLPSWCHITKYSNSFAISYDSNTSHDDRSGWFKVVSDNLDVRIDVTQLGIPLNVRANFNYCSIQHNTINYSINNYDKCLKINANVTIRGAKGQKCLIVAFFSDVVGNNIKATYKYPNYAISSSRDLYAATEVVPTSDEAQTLNTVIYVPNDAMALLKKKNKIRCQLFVYCVKTSSYISNAKYTLGFKAKKKRGKITTKKL